MPMRSVCSRARFVARGWGAKELTLPINRLCDEDIQWLYKNENKIRANGDKIRRFVLANGL